MGYSSIITPAASKIAVSHAHALGVADYDLDELYSPDTAFWRSKVLDLASPKYSPNKTYIFDKSRYGTHGIITGATWSKLSSGQSVLNYDGNDYVEFSAPQMNFTSGDFSIFAWVKSTSVTTYNFILCRGCDSVDGYYFRITDVGSLQFITHQSGGLQISSSASGAVVNGQYYRLGAVRSGASVRIYKSGADVTSAAGSHTNPATCARTVKIGIYDDKVSYPLKGQTGAITVIAVAMTPDWVAQDFARDKWLYGI